jgi:hypothetical protein
VFTETAYYLGWLYPMVDLAWLEHSVHSATAAAGRLLLANTIGRDESGIMTPWLIRTCRDLFGHIGYALDDTRHQGNR